MAVISKGIKLFAREDTEYVELQNLMEIPDLGGDTEAIEITTLADAAHKYTDGIKNYGDSLTFKFLYETEQFKALGNGSDGVAGGWKVVLPDGATCEFEGSFAVKLDAVGVNSALTYTLSIKPTSEMVWTVVTE
jgi:hypothetical protein